MIDSFHAHGVGFFDAVLQPHRLTAGESVGGKFVPVVVIAVKILRENEALRLDGVFPIWARGGEGFALHGIL